jgi:hypothetical protein
MCTTEERKRDENETREWEKKLLLISYHRAFVCAVKAGTGQKLENRNTCCCGGRMETKSVLEACMAIACEAYVCVCV